MSQSFSPEEILEMFRECMPIFTVLSDEHRQHIVVLLSQHDEGLNVNAITEQMPLSRPAISHHLKVLKQAGIVNSEKKGTESTYFLTFKTPLERVKNLISIIEYNCTIK